MNKLQERLAKKCDEVIDLLSGLTIPEKEFVLRTLHTGLLDTARKEGIKIMILKLQGGGREGGGDLMATLKHKVTCATCGKRERIKIVNSKIPKNWYYFGKMNVNVCQMSKYSLTPKDPKHPLDDLIKIPNPCYDPKAKRKLVECWECEKCYGEAT